MKFLLPGLLFCLFSHLLAAQTSFLEKQPWAETWAAGPDEQQDIPGDPGWWEQYHRMKADASGNIPRLDYYQLYQQEMAHGQRNSILENVNEVGPKNFGGRTRAILIDESNHLNLFCGGVSGGLWVSHNQGSTWAPINDYLQSPAVTCITQNHFNPDIIYFGTGETAGNSASIPGNGVFKSTDHGLTFVPLPSTASDSFDYIPSIKTSTVDSNTLFFGTNNKGFFKSTNGGLSFHLSFATGNRVDNIQVFPDGSVMIGVNTQGIYYSASGDSGTFTHLAGGLPSVPFKRVEMAYCQQHPQVIYACFENGNGGYYSGILNMYKTINGGISWDSIGNPDVDFGFYMSFVWYSCTMAVKPDNPNFVVFGVGDLVYTEDGGSNWFNCNASHPDQHALVFDPADPTLFYNGCDGGLYKFSSNSMGSVLQNLNSGYSTIQYYAGAYGPAGIQTLGGAQDNGTFYSNDASGQLSWVFGGDGAFCGIDQQTPNVSYASYQNGTISRSDNTGPGASYYSIMNELDADFDGAIDEGAWFVNPFELNPLDGLQVYFVTQKRVWGTQDGNSWAPLMHNVAGGSAYCAGLSNDLNPVVYLGGENAMLYKISNPLQPNPGSEKNQTNHVPLSITSDFIANIKVDPNDSTIIYFSLSNSSAQPRVWKAIKANTDSIQFIPIAGDLPAKLPVNWVECDPAHPDSFLIAATDFGLYVSQDAGIHWMKDPTIPNVPIMNIRLRNSDRKLFIFTHGRGLWVADLPHINGWGISMPVASPEFQLYPNPATNACTVSCSASGLLRYQLMTVSGEVLQTGSFQGKATLETASLPPAYYLLQVTGLNFRETRKLVVTHE